MLTSNQSQIVELLRVAAKDAERGDDAACTSHMEEALILMQIGESGVSHARQGKPLLYASQTGIENAMRVADVSGEYVL